MLATLLTGMGMLSLFITDVLCFLLVSETLPCIPNQV